jgi:hypothetical protein
MRAEALLEPGVPRRVSDRLPDDRRVHAAGATDVRLESAQVVGIRLDREDPAGWPNGAAREQRVRPDVRAGVDDGGPQPELAQEEAAVLGLVRTRSQMRKVTPMPEVAAKGKAVEVRAKGRPAEPQEGRVGSISAGPHQPSQTDAAGQARTGAERRENRAAHERQHGSLSRGYRESSAFVLLRNVDVQLDRDVAGQSILLDQHVILRPFDHVFDLLEDVALHDDEAGRVVPNVRVVGETETDPLQARDVRALAEELVHM